MKKILLSLAIFSVTGVFAQKNARIFKSNELISKDLKTENIPGLITEKTITTLWLDNFSNASTWSIDNSGQTEAAFGWNINNSSQGWWSANGISATGTSGGNNAELVNGDPTESPATQALNVVYTMTTAAPINIVALGGNNQVSLQFKQFGARFNDLQEIQISTDGSTFVTVGDNLDKEVLSAAGGSPYPNPDTKTINLASYLSTNPTSVWIRFRWTTNFPASATNPNVWITYGWYIDDVRIITNPDYDLSTTFNYWGTAGLNYYQIPSTQIAPIDFSSDVLNGGLVTLSSAMLKAEVFQGATNVFTGMSAGTVVPSLDTASLDVTTSFTPPANVANYTIKRKIILGYLPNGQILSGSLSGAGSGYSTASGVGASGGSGTGASFNLIASANGVVSGGTITSGGSGYNDATGVATSGGSGSGLTLDISTNPGSGEITSANISSGGTGYLVGDFLEISGGNSDAIYTIDAISGGAVTSVTLNNVGSGYTAGDVLTLAGGSATYTVGTVTNNTEIVDELPGNNTIADVNFGVTNFIYARDNNTFAGSTSNGTDGFEVGNLFDIWSDQTLNGLTIRLAGGANGTAVGTEIFVKIYGIENGDFAFIEESAPFIVAANNTNTLLTIPFLSPVNLVTGETYLVVVGSYDATLKVSNAGSSQPQTCFFKDLADDTWYYTTSTPVVRMNFDPTVGMSDAIDLVSEVKVYPNPTDSEATLEFNLSNNSDVVVTITDILGKIVSLSALTNTQSGLNSISLNCSSYQSGIYYVAVESNGSKITKKFIKK